MSNLLLVNGDDAPAIKVTLTRAETDEIIDLSDKTVVFKFRRKGATSVLQTISNSAQSTDLANGVAIFEWGLTDLDVAAGNYEAEIEITNTVGRVETVYETVDFSVREDF